ncbi:MAG: helix-hairpin-helix domain-containing protein [Candidatus Natronoplasma sp.]
MRSNSRNKKKTNSSVSRRNKRFKSELQNLKKEKKQLKTENEKLKQHKEKLEEKIDSLKEKNRKLLHQIEEGNREKDKIGIRLPSNSVIKGDIESEKGIEVENEVRIVGSLKSKEDIILGYGNKIEGDIVSESGDVKAGNATEIGGIIIGQKIHLAEGVEAGQIKGEEKITIEDNCNVSDIFALGDVDIGEFVKIDGTICHTGDFSVSRGINVTDSIMHNSREEIEKEAEETMMDSLPLLPMIIREGFMKGEDETEEIEKEEMEIDEESVRHKIETVKSLIKSARDQRLDISEERSYLKKGISLFKKRDHAEAKEQFAECERMLEKKLNIEDDEIDDESEEEEEEQSTDETEKEKVIETFQKIQGVGPSLAEEIYAEGFHSIEELRDAPESELLEINGIGKSFSKTIKEDLD